MKRKALLIGNTNGLQGVQIDIEKTKKFLKSPQGGTWYDREVEIFSNPKKAALLKRIEELRYSSLDYLILLFSGHGGQERQTLLELNAMGETVNESQLKNIAERQLNIYDCCRASTQRSIALGALSASFSESVTYARQRYENRIMKAIPQQIQLYSCAIGQVSYDTPNGAVYLSNLISAATEIRDEFVTVGSAHDVARAKTIQENPSQTPEAVLPKCLMSQQLIISMRV
jgi:hypothetical protein